MHSFPSKHRLFSAVETPLGDRHQAKLSESENRNLVGTLLSRILQSIPTMCIGHNVCIPPTVMGQNPNPNVMVFRGEPLGEN